MSDFKFREDELMQELREYIESTYGQHYVGGQGGTDALQIQELFHSIGIAVPFCQANAIKYLARYGKKGGKNRKDLLKALHYAILLMYFEDDLADQEGDWEFQDTDTGIASAFINKLMVRK